MAARVLTAVPLAVPLAVLLAVLLRSSRPLRVVLALVSLELAPLAAAPFESARRGSLPPAPLELRPLSAAAAAAAAGAPLPLGVAP